MKKLKTDRLILRPWKKSDLDDLYEYSSVPGVGEMAGWPRHQSKEESAEILRRFIDKGDGYAMVLKENKKVIGSLGIHDGSLDVNFKANTQKTIGFVLSKTYWGRGLATEAAQAAINYAFLKLNIDVLWCEHFAENPQSKKVIEKCGFVFYGKGTHDSELLGKSFVTMKYVMTKNDYKAIM